jgi:hypothetical protein
MTQVLECQKCGEFMDTVLTDKPIISYHKDCWVEWEIASNAASHGRQWHKLKGSETTEYRED